MIRGDVRSYYATYMATDLDSESESRFRVLPGFAMIVGAVLVGIGLMFLPASLLGGAHIAAIGVSVFLAGLVSTRWAATRWNMSPADQRRWSFAFVVLAAVLMILFVIINYASFEGPIPIEEG